MIRVVKLSFHENHIDDFKQLFEARKEAIRNFEGCTHLELWQDQKNPSIFYTYSIWLMAEQLETYRLSDLFHETWSIVKCWFNDKPEAFSGHVLHTLDSFV